METIDIRCPEDPRTLFLKLKRAGEPTPVTVDNLIELSCEKCRSRLRRAGDPVRIVLHLYDLAGTCVETKVERTSPEEVERLRSRGTPRANHS